MSDRLKILPVDRKPHRHDDLDQCFCWGGALPLSLFERRGIELTQQQLDAGLGAREAAALLSGHGLSSKFYYRGQGECCMWLLGLTDGRGE